MADPTETLTQDQTPDPATAAEQAETLFGETVPADEKSEAVVAAEKKAVDDKAADDQIAANKVAEEKAAADAKTEAERVSALSEEDKTAEAKAAEEKAAEEKAAKEKLGEFVEKSSDEIAAMSAAEKAEYFKEMAAAEEAAKPAKDRDGAPDEYGDFETPEGFEKLDTDLLDKFLPKAKEFNLSQGEAQDLVNLYATAQTKAIEDQVIAWDKVREDWLTAAKADEEIGGKDFDENVGTAVKALDQFGTPALREALDQSGMGSHPEVIRIFKRIGAAISDGNVISGNLGSQNADKTQAQVMYPTMK